MKYILRREKYALGIVLMGGVAGLANAEDSLTEIVVTAQKRSESVQNVPIAVTALSAESLENAGVTTVTDLTALTPGLQAERTATYSTPYIRGVGSNSSLVGNDSSVATYLDGVYLPAKGGNLFDLFNVERIEVLKGPQGTLFGRNATGGAINVITKDPSDKLEAKFEASYGNYASSTIKAYAAGPLAENVKASVAVLHNDGGAYVHSLFGGLQGQNRSDSIMTKILYTPTDKLRIVGALDFTKSNDTEGIAGGYFPGSVPLASILGGATTTAVDTSSAGTAPGNHLTSKGASLHVNYSFDFAELVSISAYRSVNADVIYDNDGSNADIFLFDDRETGKTLSQEFQLLSNSSGPLKWMVGADYTDDRQSYAPLDLYIGMPYPATVATVQDAVLASASSALVRIASNAKDHAAALFAQATYEVVDHTRVTVGARYTREQKSFDGAESALVPNGLLAAPPNPAASTVLTPVPLASAPVTEKTFSKPTWRFSVDHDFATDLLGYISYNRGFKSGAFNTTAITPKPVPVEPETLDAYEIGVKSELLDRRLRVNAAIFHYSYKNLQVSTVDASTGVVNLQNAAKATSDGGEIEADFIVAHGFTLHAGLAGLHSEYKDYKDAAVFVPCASKPTTPGCVAPAGNAQGLIDASGDTQIYSPKFTANLGADYRVPFVADTSLLFTTQLYHNSGYDTEVGGRLKVASYSTVALAAALYTQDDKYFVRVWGQNLTDEHHAAYLSGSTQGDRIEYYPPVTFGITVGGRF